MDRDERDGLPNGLFRNASLRVMEWLFGAEELPPRTAGFQEFRFEEPGEAADAESRRRRDCDAGTLPSAGRGGDVEDLEKLGTGSESTIFEMVTILLHFGLAREDFLL